MSTEDEARPSGSEPSAGGSAAQEQDHEAMLARREELLARHPEIKLARDLGPLMGEHERAYWLWTIKTMGQEIARLRGPRYTEIREEPRV